MYLFIFQILEVNNHNFEHISHNRALEVLRGTTHLSITVKSNLLGKSQFCDFDLIENDIIIVSPFVS